MGRKRSDELVRPNKSGGYDYKVWNDVRGRFDWLSTGHTDKAKAESFAKAKLEQDEWKTLRGADMTISAAHWHRMTGDKTLSPTTVAMLNSRFQQMEPALGALKLADPDTATLVNRYFERMTKGVPVRVFAEHKHKARTDPLIRDKLHPRTIEGYKAILIADLNYVCNATVDGEPMFPARLAPHYSRMKAKELEKYKSKRKATGTALTKDQQIKLWDFTVAEARERGETRLSVDQRILIAFKLGGQRTTRNGSLPWANFKLTGGNPTVDFEKIPGVLNNDTKRGKKDLPVPEALLPILNRCHAEKTGPWFFDTPLSRSAIYCRLRRLHDQALGMNFGGGHVHRKTYATSGADAGRREATADAMGITQETLNKFYVKDNPERDRETVNAVAGAMFIPGAEPLAPVADLAARRKAKRRG